MTDGPGTEPSPPHPGAAGQPPYGYPPQYGPQQPWGGPGGPVPPAKGPGLGVAALVLGLLALVLPFLPVDMTGFRAYVAFPFGLAGLVLGVLGCIGRRSGKALAVIGAVVSFLALVAGMIMVANQVVPH
ncbi:hypothetical protein M8542_01615 [Amycolatopsis sp. OK19-0408]|uniref:Integral membrane protein n=1 Tax=Amycolatopsis iheyensis TaxID=2945988 RepID=A0A9X2N6N5_9PSEU|nr:hypothetical protein [Amycolatopsis iheyensis]MCR6481506.1 hypothetical protein [Amycolatopsis iheyensis]